MQKEKEKKSARPLLYRKLERDGTAVKKRFWNSDPARFSSKNKQTPEYGRAAFARGIEV